MLLTARRIHSLFYIGMLYEYETVVKSTFNIFPVGLLKTLVRPRHNILVMHSDLHQQHFHSRLNGRQTPVYFIRLSSRTAASFFRQNACLFCPSRQADIAEFPCHSKTLPTEQLRISLVWKDDHNSVARIYVAVQIVSWTFCINFPRSASLLWIFTLCYW